MISIEQKTKIIELINLYRDSLLHGYTNDQKLIASRIVDYLNSITEIKYPFIRLDSIKVQNDYKSGK